MYIKTIRVGVDVFLKYNMFLIFIILIYIFFFRLLNSCSRLSMTRNSVWAVSNLCRGKVPPPDFTMVSPALPVLSDLLSHDDSDVLADTCWALSYLSDGPNEKIQAVIDAKVCPTLVELLM